MARNRAEPKQNRTGTEAESRQAASKEPAGTFQKLAGNGGIRSERGRPDPEPQEPESTGTEPNRNRTEEKTNQTGVNHETQAVEQKLKTLDQNGLKVVQEPHMRRWWW